ncbi:signal peptidase I [Arthrobacter methylotrophus]|uniref:Signal peptidase I n=1 Tax=Arthrobacter methylotrophus TaxID=121291 RepID=A0ABV5UP22_9MICC
MTTLAMPEIIEPSHPSAAPKSLRSLLADTFTYVALGSALALLVAGGVLPALTGGKALTVMTGSMAPSLPPGHILVYQPVPADSLKSGDVIAYQPDTNITGGIPITHRVIEVDSNDGHVSQIIVQGDANPAPDKPVKPGQIIGKMVYYIPFAGMLRVLAFHAGLDWLANVVCLAIVGYCLLMWARGTRRRRGSTGQSAQTDPTPPS